MSCADHITMNSQRFKSIMKTFLYSLKFIVLLIRKTKNKIKKEYRIRKQNKERELRQEKIRKELEFFTNQVRNLAGSVGSNLKVNG